MKKSLSLLLLSLLCLVAQAQRPVVPNNIYFADIHLQIQESARTEIQKVVDALTKHPAYFQKKVDLADAYFPFIEQAFKQEGVPSDFKYLVLQESGLVSDAVSTSNAVGFWQFKEGSATELGIKVNSLVDERKHIIESSRGAARYMLRSNAYYKNWFNTLLSYYQGLNGTKALTKTSDIGSKNMEVTGQTNKYLLTFLAHKVAYENAIGKNPNPTITLQPVKATPGQTLTEIAMAAQADAAEVERYNKWLMASTVPADKEYTVMIPYVSGAPRPVLASAGPVRTSSNSASKATANKPQDSVSRISGFFQTIKAKLNNTYTPASVVAQTGDTKEMLALKGNISTSKFLRVNDLRPTDEVVAGKTYYFQAKRAKAKDTEFHVAQRGETMHDISQKYAVKLNKLLSKNRMQKTESVEPGRVVWLQETRPSSIPVEIRPLEEETTTDVLAQTSAPAAQPIASAPKTTPAATPKTGAISVEVEDTTVPPYVKKTPKDEVATAPASATYPAKAPAASSKPAPVLERKAPTETVISDVKVAPAQPVAIPASGTHLVEKGETFYSISRKYGISVANLLAWNNMDGSTPLALGKELVLTGEATAATTAPVSTPVPATTTAPTSATAPVTASAPVKATPAIAPVASSGTEHTVAPSETLYAISRKYGVSVQDLQTWNNLGTGAISIGQKLVVSAPAAPVETIQADSAATPGTATITHKVAAGESMYAISRKYGVTVQQIQEWNNKTDHNVSVGESLIIKPKQ
ncbi:LysM peptidoglycan-binding domain-containing protein [Rufibacter latericius]|uniref:LysM peptidoglycan-binding domain-containing protein n=1 Tax=Rufibacter latericius TaxID=2487040 RepID=A0A3M9N0I3_9BACT|nr:LysM peptidoglycan-binding domain-containing protein [Rufibacter latericius]RNI31309.1 LysM peptidoglycan-binding domain-containing protein [Rufibacter latericius]